MAVIRDVMPAFELFQPASPDDAVALLAEYGSDAWVMAGGLDSFDWLKDRIKRPKVVVDLSQIPVMRGVREYHGGVEIGAMTTGHNRRECVAGHALLVLPQRISVLSRGRQYLLCGYADRHQP